MPTPDHPASVLRWGGGATWWAGTGALEAALPSAVRDQRVRVLLDANVAATPAGAALRARIDQVAVRSGASVTYQAHDPAQPATARLVDEVAQEWEQDPVGALLLVGGGSTIDLGVLSLLPADERALLRAGGRSGLVLLPETPRDVGRPTCVAIPTTLGTGAETSAVACVDHGGKRLVVGAWLRPDVSICDEAATDGLPERLVREAVVEIMARLVVPFAATSHGVAAHPLSTALGDEVLLADLRVLLRAADQLRTSPTSDALLRMTIAAVSAHTHGGWANVGRASFSSPVWFVGTELSHVLDVSKATATALLLPTWAELVLAGRPGWGDADRLRQLAATLDPGADPADVVRRTCALVVPPAPLDAHRLDDEDVVGDVADRCMRRWGGGLPMLAGLVRADVEALVGGALSRTRREGAVLCSI
ncbi:iron-containing alcohol dehydrogenase [Cellulomonas chengniuliangii]|uniref:iron-containing alcohol dehydrogenase n=1 Tax=Cellulomonas chengniuliangii TaxID=2968084 RepID=UPI001D0DC5C5|nr:iron-containing alcohol dehydrogenase [Cellulomonas chengniuliangii]MCC2317136.1 iron-containing alcohol dehydrogenase [Cellulomonas chengniuliangii]